MCGLGLQKRIQMHEDYVEKKGMMLVDEEEEGVIIYEKSLC